MKRETLSYMMLLALIVSACGAQPTPTADPVDIQGTAAAAAFTLLAETQAAKPTDTLIPPTETQLPTDTVTPSPTVDAFATPTFTLSPTGLPTFTPQPAAGNDLCNKALLTWQGPSASFTVVNETRPRGEGLLLMSVLTRMGECGWLNIYSTSFSGPVGSYSAAAFVDGQNDFKVFGAFSIIEGGWKIIVRNDVITAQGGCYPNC